MSKSEGIHEDETVAFQEAFQAETGRRFAKRVDKGILRAGRVVDEEARPFGLHAHIAEVSWGYAVVHVRAVETDGSVVGEFSEVTVENHADPRLIADRIAIEHARLCSYARS